MGLDRQTHFQTCHRVLNRAVWSSLAASRILLSLPVRVFAPEGPLILDVDDTIERRWGARIAARGRQHVCGAGFFRRDPAPCHRHHPLAPGHRLVCASATAMWYYKGAPAVSLRWALIRDPLGQFDTQALLCTDQNATPAFILEVSSGVGRGKSPSRKRAPIWASRRSDNGRTRPLPAPRLAC